MIYNYSSKLIINYNNDGMVIIMKTFLRKLIALIVTIIFLLLAPLIFGTLVALIFIEDIISDVEALIFGEESKNKHE